MTRSIEVPLNKTLTVSVMFARKPGLVASAKGSGPARAWVRVVEDDMVDMMELARPPLIGENPVVVMGEGKVDAKVESLDCSLVRCCSMILAKGTSSGITGLKVVIRTSRRPRVVRL